MSTEHHVKSILEAAIFAAGEPLDLNRLSNIFEEEERPSKEELEAYLEDMMNEMADRSYILKETASGYSIQIKQDYAPWIAKLWQEKPPKYSRAFLETLAIIAYRQPVTRGEIENIRGVAVSTYIMKTLLEREWVRIIGHRDVPGRPGIYGTTKTFLDYFNLKNLEDLPTLKELMDLDQVAKQLGAQLELPLEGEVEGEVDEQEASSEDVAEEADEATSV